MKCEHCLRDIPNPTETDEEDDCFCSPECKLAFDQDDAENHAYQKALVIFMEYPPTTALDYVIGR